MSSIAAAPRFSSRRSSLACPGSERSTASAQEPRERDLSRRRILPGCDMAEQIDDWLVGLPGIGSKARKPGPNIELSKAMAVSIFP